MRLALNGEYLNISQNKPEAQFIKKALTLLLDEYGDNGNIRLAWADAFKSVGTLVTPNGDSRKVIEYPTGKNFLLKSNYRCDTEPMKMTAEFTLYESEKIHKEGFTEFNPKKYTYSKEETISFNDQEKLFWMVFVNPHCQVMRGLEKYQNQVRKTAYYTVFSPIRQAQKEISESGQRSKVVYLLTTKDKGIALSDDKVRDIAYAMFIPNAVNENMDVLRAKLLNVINSPAKYDEFDRLLDSKDYLELCGLIQRSIDQKVIAVKMNEKSAYWCYWNADNNSYGQKIIDIRAMEEKEPALIRYLGFNKEARAKLEMEFNATVKTEE